MNRAHYYRLPDYVRVPIDLLDCEVIAVVDPRSGAQTDFYRIPTERRWIKDTKPDPRATGIVTRHNPLNQGLVEVRLATVREQFFDCNAALPRELLDDFDNLKLAPARQTPEKRPTSSQMTSEIPDHVTLSQAAAVFKKTKPTLVKHKKTLPPPITKVEPGSGQADLWEWPPLRIWGSKTFGIPLEKIPEIHPHTELLRRKKTGRKRYKAPPRKRPNRYQAHPRMIASLA
jgi:hypothetical protein